MSITVPWRLNSFDFWHDGALKPNPLPNPWEHRLKCVLWRFVVQPDPQRNQVEGTNQIIGMNRWEDRIKTTLYPLLQWGIHHSKRTKQLIMNHDCVSFCHSMINLTLFAVAIHNITNPSNALSVANHSTVSCETFALFDSPHLGNSATPALSWKTVLKPKIIPHQLAACPEGKRCKPHCLDPTLQRRSLASHRGNAAECRSISREDQAHLDMAKDLDARKDFLNIPGLKWCGCISRSHHRVRSVFLDSRPWNWNLGLARKQEHFKSTGSPKCFPTACWVTRAGIEARENVQDPWTWARRPFHANFTMVPWQVPSLDTMTKVFWYGSCINIWVTRDYKCVCV